MLNRTNLIYLALLVSIGITIQGCDDIFGTKENSLTDNIFEEGKQDPTNVVDVVGYAALKPFWTGFDEPNEIYIGYDELVYVTDNRGVTVLDLAGRPFQTFEIPGANGVTMDRNLNLYVSGRIDYDITLNNQEMTFNLPAVYKLRGLNQGDPVMIDTLIFPFDDASLSTGSAQTRRLDKDDPDSYENVEVTGLSTLADNTLYISRSGPVNNQVIAAPDNTVLEFQRIRENGELTEKMTNVRQIRSLNALRPSLISGVGISSITSFVGPPQRESLSDNRSFLLTQSDQTQEIPYRVLWINAVETVDGLVYQPNTSLLQQDTASANGFMYTTGKFQNPTDVAYANDGTGYIFVTDAAKDSVYLFQSNGYEGVTPPAGSEETKAIVVSFGGEGSGPKQFIDPSGVDYFDEVLYVADRGNGRIARYKLTTDFE